MIAITVGQLIERLQKFDEDIPILIRTEGRYMPLLHVSYDPGENGEPEEDGFATEPEPPSIILFSAL